MCNLGLASPRCHQAKHHGWLLIRHPDGSVTWTSPLDRVYHRPSPHDPPPRIDPYQDPPPLRRPPTATPTRWATAAPRPPTGEPPPAGGEDVDETDDPPPF